MINSDQNLLSAEFAEIFQNYLDRISRIVILLLDQQKNILDCNHGFLGEFGLEGKPIGAPLSDFLEVEEGKDLHFPDFIPLKPPLRGAVHGLVGHQKSAIRFVDRENGTKVLNCCLFNLGIHYLVLGEKN